MGFSHFDSAGNAIMVDVSEKAVTTRTAVAQGSIHVSPEILAAVKNGTSKKGDVLGVARVAGIMASKRTSDIIPLTHPLPITNCTVDFKINEAESSITAVLTVKTDGKTGVEMEALTGVSATLLTIYDMCKAIDKRMCIGDVHLVEKHGGKSGDFIYEKAPTVLAISGIKKSGKTMLIEKLIPLLSERSIKTAIVKHDAHCFTPDTPGTDTFRFFQAGACGTVIFDSEKYSLTRRVPASREALIEMFPGADLILLEGFSRSTYPKIEIIPENSDEAPICDPNTCVAYVCAGAFETDKSVFHPDDIKSVLDFVISFAERDKNAR